MITMSPGAPPQNSPNISRGKTSWSIYSKTVAGQMHTLQLRQNGSRQRPVPLEFMRKCLETDVQRGVHGNFKDASNDSMVHLDHVAQAALAHAATPVGRRGVGGLRDARSRAVEASARRRRRRALTARTPQPLFQQRLPLQIDSRRTTGTPSFAKNGK